MSTFIKKVKTKYELETAIDQKSFEKDLRTLGYVVKGICVTAMSFEKKDAIKKLNALSLQITEHLVRILVLPNVSHWQAELKAWQNVLRRYNNGKNKSGINYTTDLLMKHLWEEPLETAEDQNTVLKILAEAGYAVPPTFTPEQRNKLKKSVKKFISEVLATKIK